MEWNRHLVSASADPQKQKPLRNDWEQLCKDFSERLRETQDRPATILVTGWRGTGKLPLVHHALEAEAQEKREEKDKDKKIFHLTVPVRVARAISPAALMRRIVRKTYLTLSGAMIGEAPSLRPVVAQARIAFMRACGERVSLSAETREKVGLVNGLKVGLVNGLKVDGLSSGIELGATHEREVAESLLRALGPGDFEDIEDEMETLAMVVGQTTQRTASASAVAGIAKLGETIKGTVRKLVSYDKARFQLTLVLHGIDHLDSGDEPRADDIRDFGTLIRDLRGVLGLPSLRVIVIAGGKVAVNLVRDRLQPDGLLPIMFTDHFHVPLAERGVQSSPKEEAVLVTGGAPWRHVRSNDTNTPMFKKAWGDAAGKFGTAAKGLYSEVSSEICQDCAWLNLFYGELPLRAVASALPACEGCSVGSGGGGAVGVDAESSH